MAEGFRQQTFSSVCTNSTAMQNGWMQTWQSPCWRRRQRTLRRRRPWEMFWASMKPLTRWCAGPASPQWGRNTNVLRPRSLTTTIIPTVFISEGGGRGLHQVLRNAPSLSRSSNSCAALTQQYCIAQLLPPCEWLYIICVCQSFCKSM